MTEKQLKNGQRFHFDNEEWCNQNLSDDLREGFVTCDNQWGVSHFAIHFNGACIHSSKTFNSSKKRLEKLMNDWNCEFTE